MSVFALSKAADRIETVPKLGSRMEVGKLALNVGTAVKTKMQPGSQCYCAAKIGQNIEVVTDGFALQQSGLTLEQIDALASGRNSTKFNATEFHTQTDLVLVQRTVTDNQTTGKCDWFQDRELPLYFGWERGTLIVAVVERESSKELRAQQIKWRDKLLGHASVSCSAFESEISEDWHDIRNSMGDVVGRLRLTVTATTKQTSATVRRHIVIDVKQNKTFGSKFQLRFCKDSAKYEVLSGAKIKETHDFASIAAVDSDGAAKLLHLSHRNSDSGDLVRTTYLCNESDGVAAAIQAILHEYHIDVAIPFLVTRYKEKARDRETLRRETYRKDFCEQMARRSDATDLLAKHQAELNDDPLIVVPPAERLNCELLFANTDGDIAKALNTYQQQFSHLISAMANASTLLQVSRPCF
eukprot:SAG31_NODE_6891_length_1859_cov_0.990341_1_plen_412_part_00